MNRLPFNSLNSLRNRMLLIFLLLISVIIAVTLQVVQTATYSHSTGQLLDHAQTSASVVRDKITNKVNILNTTLGTLAKDFSIKQLIASSGEDTESLRSAMGNQQRRIGADFYLVFDARQELITGSIDKPDFEASPADFANTRIQWIQLNNQFYLAKSTPVKFIESSKRINAWIMMGVQAEKLISHELNELTGMQVTLLFHGDTEAILGSTFAPELQNELDIQALSFEPDLHTLNIENNRYIYTTETISGWLGHPIHILLATIEDKAYLSYNSLLFHLVGILVIAAVLALFAAMLLSRGITGPISSLMNAAKKISRGEVVTHFPASSTNEINSLSRAIEDMQEGIKEREIEINSLAYFDKLTQLPNRNQFSNYLTEAISQDKNAKVTVLMMDVDRFKEINDTVGHDIGDRLLILIAKRMMKYAGKEAFYARIGGDEFGIVFNDSNERDPAILVSGVASIFDLPFSIDGLVLDIDASIGVALYPYDAETPQGLMQCADIALYSCKGHPNSYAIYKPELNKYSVQRLNLMSELREALSEGQLNLYYQPKLSIENNQISSVECLIRWIHPVHGFVPPDDFIPLAEQTGAIRDVTHWVMRESLKQQKTWRENGIDLAIAVNISALDLIDMKLPPYVAELMKEFGTSPHMLTLEVTESAVMSDPTSALQALNTLQEMGISLSVDDFGTGYSSMAQLKKMPVNELKIDKAFVLDLANNNDDKVMVKTLVSLAQNLGLRTVAEGVEDKIALDYLASIGCTKAQGYYLSRPLPATDFEQWYRTYLASSSAEQAV